MKGLTHFMSGVALASCFPEAVRMAASTSTPIDGASASFILVLGGLYGIMPDTLDFKFGQYLSPGDVDVDCNPLEPDAEKMARQIGQAMDQAAETEQLVKVQLYPMRMGTNLWRQYVITFDAEAGEVVVVLGDIVSTSQVPYVGTAPKEKAVGRYKLRQAKILDAHGRPSVVDILSGPQFGFRPQGKKVVAVEFLPWHRTWSHSYVLGAMLAAPVAALAWYLQWTPWWLYGLIAFLGFAVHITEDLTGHMGGSLLWPFVGKRYDGFCWFSASNPHMNFLVDFTCVVIVLFNLNLGFPLDARPITLPVWQYWLFCWAIPVAIYQLIRILVGPPPMDDKKMAAVNAVEMAKDDRAREQALRNEELRYEEESLGI